jgi:electron transport complex protein RnfE
MAETTLWSEFSKGVSRQNGLFLLALGICPALAVTASLQTAVAMGVAVIFVQVCSSVLIGALGNAIPEEARFPSFIVITGSLVTVVELAFKATLPPATNLGLGIYIPLIAVNCTILYRVEAFAHGLGALRSLLDGLGLGVGFAVAMCLIGALREAFGSGTIWGYPWVPVSWPVRYVPSAILAQAPGAFIVLGLLMALFKWAGSVRAAR